MTRWAILLFSVTFLLLAQQSSGQTASDSIYNIWWANKGRSIFQLVDSGKFYGTTTGYIHLVNNKDTLPLDFQTTETALTVNKIKEPVYDNRTKIYSTQTTSGKTTLEYETFMLANILTIILNGEHYSIGVFDGACDTPVFGLTFNYCNEKNTEYLTLFVTKPIQLTTTRYLMTTKNIYYQDAQKNAKTITVLPGSTLILTIKK